MQTPDSPPKNVQAQLRMMKQVYYIMVFSVGVYVLLLFRIGQGEGHLSHGSGVGIEICALVSALGILFVRFIKTPGILVPGTSIPIAERMTKLRLYFILSCVFSETVALYGFAFRFMGGSVVEAAPFFAGSLLLYALCYPRLPLDLDENRR